MREMFTVADMFGINFPRDLDVKIKAVLLGACLLIVSIMKMQTIANEIANNRLFKKRDTKKKRMKKNIAV